MTFWSVLFWAGALHGYYLAVIFALRREDKGTNRLFALILFLFSFHLTNYLLFISELIQHIPHFLSVQTPLLYLIGPAIFFYVRSQLRVPLWRHALAPLHFLPAIFFFFRKLPVYRESAEFKLEIIQKYFSGLYQPSFLEAIVSLSYLMHILLYLMLSFLTVVRAEKSQIKSDAWDSIIYGEWKKLMVAYAALLSLTLTFFLSAHAFGFDSPSVELGLVFMLAISIHVLGYVALKRPSQPNVAGFKENSEKYLTSPLTMGAMKRYGKQLVKIMQSEKPFLKPDLTVTDLATKLNIPRHHLSQLLNQELGTTFYDFVNEYRLEEAKSRLKDARYSNYKISAIASDAGFRNKISFNRTFKKKTGLTPSEYRDA